MPEGLEEKDQGFDDFFTEATDEVESEEVETEEEEDFEGEGQEEEETPVDDKPLEGTPDDEEEDSSEEDEELVRLREELERERQRFRSFEGRYRKEKEEWQKKLKPSEDEDEDETPVRQSGNLKEFIDDYPEIAGPVREMIQMEVSNMLKDIKQELTGIKSEVVPLKQHYTMSAEEQHLKTITDAHPDFIKIGKSKEFNEWVESRPSHIYKAVKYVIEEGTAQEVVDLLTDFKQDVNWKSKQTSTAKPNIKVPNTTEEDERIKKLKAASAVPASRSNPPKSNKEPQDFDEVFNQITS